MIHRARWEMLIKFYGKDTTTGHVGDGGYHSRESVFTYQRIPVGRLDAFVSSCRSGIPWNVPAPPEIIKQLEEEHVRTGKPIVYPRPIPSFKLRRMRGDSGRASLR